MKFEINIKDIGLLVGLKTNKNKHHGIASSSTTYKCKESEKVNLNSFN